MGDVLAVVKGTKLVKDLTDLMVRHSIDGIFAKNRGQMTEALSDEAVDVILIDFTMDNEEGYRLCEFIKESDAYEKMPVIGWVDDLTDIEMVFKLGVVDVHHKTLPELALLQKLRIYLDNKNTQRQLNDYKQEVSRLNNENESMRRRIEMVSVQDVLTNLYNRKFAMEQLEIAISRFDRAGVGFSIILCDIDDFKGVNDKYGPKMGDEVLMSIGQMLKYHSRVQDIVSRWGGEEFAMILPDTSLEGAMIYADRARERVEKKLFSCNGEEFSITMTFGVSVYSKVMPLNMIISQADDALFYGKTNGKNTVMNPSHVLT